MAALEQAAGVEPQVEDQPAHVFALQLRQHALQLGGRIAAERRQPHAADALLGIEEVIPRPIRLAMIAQHGFQVDLLALERHFFFGRLAGVHDRQRHGSPFIAFEFLHGLVERQAVGALAVDFQNAIAGQHSRPVGGRAVHRADDLELAVVGRDLNADAPELALHAGAEAVQIVRPDVARIRVELAEDAADGRLDQIPPVDLDDVVPLHLIDRIDEHLVQFIVVVLGLLCRFRRGVGDGRRGAEHKSQQQPKTGKSSHKKTLLQNKLAR